VIEQARADDDVEDAVLRDRQIAHVVLVEYSAVEAERVAREVALGDARGAAFDADDLAAVGGELEGVVPLEAGQVENPALRQGLADDVAAEHYWELLAELYRHEFEREPFVVVRPASPSRDRADRRLTCADSPDPAPRHPSHGARERRALHRP
jgi:hypothetical protein